MPGARCRNATFHVEKALIGLANSLAAAKGATFSEGLASTAGTTSSAASESEALRMLKGAIDNPFRRSASISLLMKV